MTASKNERAHGTVKTGGVFCEEKTRYEKTRLCFECSNRFRYYVRTVSIFRDFKAHPGLYEKLGIPWYKDVLDIAEYTIIILFVTLAIKLVVRIKMKRQ